jgi:hypothetical protein
MLSDEDWSSDELADATTERILTTSKTNNLTYGTRILASHLQSPVTSTAPHTHHGHRHENHRCSALNLFCRRTHIFNTSSSATSCSPMSEL